MNQADFDEILEARIEDTRKTLASKAKEYASNDDRLHNFKVAAQFSKTGETPEQALWGMYRKHLVSILDIVDNTAKGILPSREVMNEKNQGCRGLSNSAGGFAY